MNNNIRDYFLNRPGMSVSRHPAGMFIVSNYEFGITDDHITYWLDRGYCVRRHDERSVITIWQSE